MARKYRGTTPRKRRIVFTRDNFTCQLCGFRPHDVPSPYDGRYSPVGVRADGKSCQLNLDHVIPVIAGGSHDIGNMQTLCDRCNGRKAGHI